LRLALCHEAIGKLASAWLEFVEVERVSKAGAIESAKLRERVRIANEHLGTLGPRVPKLIVNVPAAARTGDLRVTANGSPRNEGSWGVAIPIDPGDVQVSASAAGRRAFQTVIHVGEGQTETVDVPPLTPEERAAPPRVEAPVPVARPSPALRPLGIALGAAGIVSLGFGTYFGLRAVSKWGDADRACPQASGCSDQAVSLSVDAKHAATLADITVGLGVAALAAGIVLYLTGARSTADARAGTLSVAF
jgi:hypothetical protein